MISDEANSMEVILACLPKLLILSLLFQVALMPNQKMRNFTSTGYFTKVFQVPVSFSNPHLCCEGSEEPGRAPCCGRHLELSWSDHLRPQQCGREGTGGNRRLLGEGLQCNLRVSPGIQGSPPFSLAFSVPGLLTCMQNSSAISQDPGRRAGHSQKTSGEYIIILLIYLHTILFRAVQSTHGGRTHSLSIV